MEDEMQWFLCFISGILIATGHACQLKWWCWSWLALLHYIIGFIVMTVTLLVLVSLLLIGVVWSVRSLVVLIDLNACTNASMPVFNKEVFHTVTQFFPWKPLILNSLKSSVEEAHCIFKWYTYSYNTVIKNNCISNVPLLLFRRWEEKRLRFASAQ